MTSRTSKPAASTTAPPSSETLPGFRVAPPAPASSRYFAEPPTPRMMMERAIMWITIGALAVAVIIFLWAMNDFISIWFRYEWAPLARGISSAAVIIGCIVTLRWLVDRRRAA